MVSILRAFAWISNLVASLLMLLGLFVMVLSLSALAMDFPWEQFQVIPHVFWFLAVSGLLLTVGAYMTGKRRPLGLLLLLLPVALPIFVGAYLVGVYWALFVLILFGVPLLIHKGLLRSGRYIAESSNPSLERP
jgi:peptidoglycan/LPS O-acetylase OafA/YrhL